MRPLEPSAPWKCGDELQFWRRAMEELAVSFNREDMLSTDPVEYLHLGKGEPALVGLLSSGLAFGGVKQIRAAIGNVLQRLGGPLDYSLTPDTLVSRLSGFQHRWATGPDVAVLLAGAAALGDQEMEELVRGDDEPDYTEGLARLRARILEEGRAATGQRSAGDCLLPDPLKGSTVKRLHLFLRWMVRRDPVDVGCWGSLTPARLLIPMDTHIFRISVRLGLTARRQPDLSAVRQVTEQFRVLNPEDPVKYDFALTRLGMLRESCLVDGSSTGTRLLEELLQAARSLDGAKTEPLEEIIR